MFTLELSYSSLGSASSMSVNFAMTESILCVAREDNLCHPG